MYRPEGWEEQRDDWVDKVFDDTTTYSEDVENSFEAGADAMYEAIAKARPSDDEIRIRIIEALYGAVSMPDFEKWLKERLLLKP